MNYFEKRALAVEEKTNAKTLKLDKKLKSIFKQCEKEIQGEIDAIIRKYGSDNKLTFAQAKRFIKSKRLDVLNNLLKQIGVKVDKMYEEQLKLFDEHFTDVYKDSYFRTAYEIQNYIKVYSSMAVIDKKRMESILRRKNAGENYSKRIWDNHRTKLFNDVRTQITQSVATGKTNKEMANLIADRYGVAYNNAVRLVHTESTFYLGQADLDAYEDSFIDEYEIVATLDNRTSNICREMDGRIFNVKDAIVGSNYPGFHVFCRSITVPHIPNVTNYTQRVMRNKEGKSVVGKNITYSEWYKEFGEG